MKQFKTLLPVMIMAIVMLASCQKEMKPGANTVTTNLTPGSQATAISPALKAKLAMWRKSLPAGSEKRIQKTSLLLQKVDPQYREMVQRMTNVTPAAACDANTLLTQWLGQQLADWDSDVIYFAVVTGMLDL